METAYFLKYLLDHMNNIRSHVIIEYFNALTNTVLLSNGKLVPLSELKGPADIERYL